MPTNKWNAMATYSIFAPIKMSFTAIVNSISSYRVGGFTPWGKGNSYDANGNVVGFGSASKTVVNPDGSTTYGFNSTYGGQTLVDLNMMAELTPDLSVEFQVRNLLNKDYTTPAFFASRQLNVPGAPRTFLATISYKF